MSKNEDREKAIEDNIDKYEKSLDLYKDTNVFPETDSAFTIINEEKLNLLVKSIFEKNNHFIIDDKYHFVDIGKNHEISYNINNFFEIDDAVTFFNVINPNGETRITKIQGIYKANDDYEVDILYGSHKHDNHFKCIRTNLILNNGKKDIIEIQSLAKNHHKENFDYSYLRKYFPDKEDREKVERVIKDFVIYEETHSTPTNTIYSIGSKVMCIRKYWEYIVRLKNLNLTNSK